MNHDAARKEADEQERREKATDNLYKAAGKYVELHGGKIIIAGGVQVIRFPDSKKYTWTLGIICTGKPPIPAEQMRKEVDK